MKKNLVLLCLLFLLSSPASPQAPSTKQRPLALTHVTVIDTTGAPVGLLVFVLQALLSGWWMNRFASARPNGFGVRSRTAGPSPRGPQG